MTPLQLSHIVYLQAVRNYTIFVMANGTKRVSSTTLGVHEANLDEQFFIRIHRQFLINRCYIKRIELESRAGWVQLMNGEKVPVSRRRIQEVLKQFAEIAPLD